MTGIDEHRVNEHPQRMERLRALMQARAIDAVLLGTGANLAYFTGYPSPAQSVPRPFFALLPLASDPVFFAHTGHAVEAERFSWIADVRTYQQLSRIPVELIRDALFEKGLGVGVLGMEIGSEQAFDFSLLEFERLRDALAGLDIVDAAPILWKLRIVKSPWELSCIRKACDVASAAYRTAFEFASAGMTERDVYLRMKDGLTKSSNGSIFLAITSGSGNYDLVTKPPETRALLPGDCLWMDAGCTVDGYWSDFSRAGTVGKATDEQCFAQEAIHRITTEAVRRVKPGVKASSIWEFCMRQLDALPFPISSSITQLAARTGHGLGLTMTEPPHLAQHDDTVLQEGMVITVEPGVATKYGTFHVEQNIVVTEDGADVLSLAPCDLHQIRL